MHRASIGFERSAGAYDRGRPAYPLEAARSLLNHCGVGPESRVLELGTGTGKFSGYIFERTRRLWASDPSAAMRTVFHEKFPDVPCMAARADSIPLATGSLQAVICAQAFHWFCDRKSVTEIVRVLAPGGFLGMAWNVRDEGVTWMRALTEIIDPYSGDAPRYRTKEWKKTLAENSELGELKTEAHRHVVSCDRATVLDRVGSISFIAALDESRHRDVLLQVERLLDTHDETRGRSLWDFTYRTDLFWCRRA